jgi:beta-lactamase class A
MKANVTSGPRIRAALPLGWTSADKTGAGGFGTINDVGVVWDTSGQPHVLSILTDTATGQAEAPHDNKLVADVADIALQFLQCKPGSERTG